MDKIFKNFAEEFIGDLKNVNTAELINKNPIIVTALGATNNIKYNVLLELAQRHLNQGNSEEIERIINELKQNDELTQKVSETLNKFNQEYNRIYLFDNGKAHLEINEEPEIEKFTKTRFNVLIYSGYPYYCPEGWRRYSLEITDFDKKYKDWPVAYHGTSSKNLIDILCEGFRISRGKGRACFGEGIYFSPSIEYCGHWRYATPKKSLTRKLYLQAVFQCKLRPGSFTVNRETMILDDKKEKKSQDPNIDKFKIIDPKFKNTELEWVISSKKLDELKKENKESFVIYGLMLRVTRENPKNLEINKWWNYYYDMPIELKNL
ncbi:unnamed protein product [Brachionus calyciflorus]|uniref:PARP catalytic domain-containing protein n=1 Tax=Brachionus calyciflorus TaxID=104777 RepID=A0A814R115_9BILA|nr:unnamed protein product [Brachionus calyciflorus]